MVNEVNTQTVVIIHRSNKLGQHSQLSIGKLLELTFTSIFSFYITKKLLQNAQ